MELVYLRKIVRNGKGFYGMAIPPQVVEALGTRDVLLRVKDKILEIVPRTDDSQIEISSQ